MVVTLHSLDHSDHKQAAVLRRHGSVEIVPWRAMSALPPKADMVQHDRDVRFVPKADIRATASAKVAVAQNKSKI